MPPSPPPERSFDCEYCQGVIKIPYDLAPTKAPCPYCGEEVLSPPPPTGGDAVAPSPSPEDFSAAPKLVTQAQGKNESSSSIPRLVEMENGPGEAVGKETVPAPARDRLPRPSAPPSAPSPVPSSNEDSRARSLEKEKTKANDSKAPEDAEGGPISSLKDDAVAPEATASALVNKYKSAGNPAKEEEKEEREEPVAAIVPEEPIEPDEALDPPVKSKMRPLLYFAGGLAAVLIGLIALFVFARPDNASSKPVTRVYDSPEAKRMRFLREGWKERASKVMHAFLLAETVEEKAKYVVGGETRIPDMKEFYEEGKIADQDTPLQAFSHEDLVMEDKERGLFLMRYDRPAQLAMKEFFRPVAPLEVQYKTEKPDTLLATAAMLDNFAMDPVRILAFFKGEGEDLKLDWDVFVQTKHRLMKEFLESPSSGARKIFRVRMYEDIPSTTEKNLVKVRYYRVIDPANDTDFVKIPVVVDSSLGKHLSLLNWVGIEDAKISSRGATVELAWSDDEEPRVYIKRLLCWEYLGLGGVMGNLRLNPDSETVDLSIDRVPDDG